MRIMPILTTVVGSYPVPTWLLGNTSRLVLRDAVMAAQNPGTGQDLTVADGELNRFDPSHPEANGMIDYFVSRMDGIGARYSIMT
jgi:methionine synthase II (cobalamin-independent)